MLQLYDKNDNLRDWSVGNAEPSIVELSKV